MKTLLLTLITASLTLSTFGQIPETNYQKVRKMNVLADKKRFVLGLGHAEQVKLWRSHFAYVLITEDLTPERQEYLARVLHAFESNTLTDDVEQEAKDLFDPDLGRRVFNPGPFGCGSEKLATNFTNSTNYSFKAKRPAFGSPLVSTSDRPKFVPFVSIRGKSPSVADCNCGQTSTNWGCSGSCDASSCTVTPDGCSIFYLYPCNGKCSTGSEEEQE